MVNKTVESEVSRDNELDLFDQEKERELDEVIKKVKPIKLIMQREKDLEKELAKL